MKNALVASVSAVLLFSCSEVEFIEIKPDALSFAKKSDSTLLTARCLTHTKVHLPNAKVVWSVKDPSIAKVDENGTVTPVASGQTEVMAKHDDVRATIPVEVLFTEKLRITPEKLQLVVDQEGVDLKVEALDYKGRVLKDRRPLYSSANKEVAQMGQNAVFAYAEGDTEITVRVDELSAVVPVKVTKK